MLERPVYPIRALDWIDLEDNVAMTKISIYNRDTYDWLTVPIDFKAEPKDIADALRALADAVEVEWCA